MIDLVASISWWSAIKATYCFVFACVVLNGLIHLVKWIAA